MNLCNADKLMLGSGTALLGSCLVLGVTPLGIGLPAAAFLALLTDGIARPGSSVLYPTLSRGAGHRPQIALTFDDGPDPEVTPTVLDALRQHDARATFFTIGRNLERHMDIGRRMIAEGHELGSHSWRHVRWQNFYGRTAQAADLERSARLIQALKGTTAEPLYRPPIGLKSPPLARAAHARKIRMIAWSLHSRDTTTNNPSRIADRVLSRIGPGDIVLMHDGHDLPGRHRRAGAAAVPLVLAGLKERGLTSVTVSELLSD
jgi:peptidoglycan/xylan/chitin deacetylase (PgdA/CDA1 family)